MFIAILVASSSQEYNTNTFVAIIRSHGWQLSWIFDTFMEE